MPLYSVYVHYRGTEVYFVEAASETEAQHKAVKRWQNGEDGDSPGDQDIGDVEVEKEEKR